MPHLVEMRKKFGDKLVVIGLTDEAKDVVEAYVKNNNVSYAIGYGSSSGDNYGVRGIPHAFLIASDGNVKWEGHPLDNRFEATAEKLIATAKPAVPGPDPSKGLNDLISMALKLKEIPKELTISYTRTDPVKNTKREFKVGSSLEYELLADGETEAKKGKIEEKELVALMKSLVETQFATKEFKEAVLPNVTILVAVGVESRVYKFDRSKGAGDFGKVSNALETLYAKYAKK